MYFLSHHFGSQRVAESSPFNLLYMAQKMFARHLKWRETVIPAIKKIVNMPKVVSAIELDRIAELIARHPESIGIEGLFNELGGRMPRRTLQRRLSTLAEQGKILAQGEGRAIKYRIATITGTAEVTLAALQGQATGEVYVPLSTEGKAIKAMIRQPIHQRRPVGYAIGFLEMYRPNKTAYLPDTLRDQLHALGRSPAEHAAAGTFAHDIRIGYSSTCHGHRHNWKAIHTLGSIHSG
jgi:hypothetical protein